MTPAVSCDISLNREELEVLKEVRCLGVTNGNDGSGKAEATECKAKGLCLRAFAEWEE